MSKRPYFPRTISLLSGKYLYNGVEDFPQIRQKSNFPTWVIQIPHAPNIPLHRRFLDCKSY